jgi:hypothetical protein
MYLDILVRKLYKKLYQNLYVIYIRIYSLPIYLLTIRSYVPMQKRIYSQL